MKRVVWTALLVAGAGLGQAWAQTQVVDEIVAVVEDEIIMASEVTEQLQLFLVELGIDPAQNPDMVDSLRTEVFTQLVDNIVIVKEAERREIEVSEQEVDYYLDQQINEQITRFGGEAAFRSQLEREGVSFEHMKAFYRRDIQRQLLSTRLVGAEIEADAIQVTDEQVQAYYDAHHGEMPPKPAQVRVRHLVITPKPSAEEEVATREKLRGAMARLDAGEDFAAVARDVSEDPSAPAGGELGYFSREDLGDPVIAEAAFALPDSGISGIVRSRFAYHIIQRLDTRDDKVHLRHIAIPQATGDDDVARARALMNTVVDRLEQGADFIGLVQAYSDLTDNDGDMGYYPIDGLFPQYRDAINPLPIGGISGVVTDDQGFHLFQLLDRKGETQYTFEELEERIEAILKREELATRYRAWADELREEAYVEIRKPATEIAIPQ